MLILVLFSSLFMIILLLFLISDVIQQKEVGGYDDLCPVEVIETADPDVNWAAKECMPSGMVSQVYHDVSCHPHYAVDLRMSSHIK
jgi:hypothetical protein